MQKKITATVIALVVAALVPLAAGGAAHAESSTPTATSGSADADAPTTRAATVVVGGGTWSYGVDGGKVWSAYDNRTFVHSTTVKTPNATTSSGKVAKGKIAYASRPSALFGNQSFWNIY